MKTVQVQLSSLSPIMFNAFRGQEEIPPERKLHLSSEDGKTVVLPVSYIMGFLTATIVGRSCLNTFVEAKERGEKKAEVLARVAAGPVEIPLTENGKPIMFSGWEGKVYLDEQPAQASKTARVIARRPVVRAPWRADFELFVNEEQGGFVTVERLEDWFRDGGTQVGLGAFRPFYGRFEVTRWDVT